MEDKEKSSKSALIAAIAAIIVAIITILPSIIKLFSDGSTNNDKDISIENIRDSSVITGNNNEVNTNK